jgi:putative DNA primase/helicase
MPKAPADVQSQIRKVQRGEASKDDSLPNIEHDTTQMSKFKRFFHGDEAAAFVALPEAAGCNHSPLTLTGTIKGHRPALIAANSAGAGVFMAINKVEGVGPVTDNKVTAINAVFIDADGTIELSAIKKLNPHLIVRTSHKKYHAYWLVKNLKPSEFKKVQKALSIKFGTDPSVCNPGRIMRMPGTLHMKGNPVSTKILLRDESAEPIPIKKLLKQLGVQVSLRKSDEVAGQGAQTASELKSALFSIPVAEDRTTWLKVGMAIHNAMPDGDGFSLWEEWSKRSTKFELVDQRRTWNSFAAGGGVTAASIFRLARSHGWQPSARDTKLPMNEFQLVDEFARRVKAYLRFENITSKWMLFDSPVWVDDDPQVIKACRRVVEHMIEQALLEGSEQAKRVIGRYGSVSGVRALLNEAKAHPDLNVKLSEFDRHPHLLATQNGVVDLRSGGFRAGEPSDLLKCQAPTIYDPDATCPQFMKFLKFITCNRREYAYYLQRALGYTLFGHTNEQVFFIAHGDSGNGKGTLFRLIAHVVGPYSKAVSPNLLSRAYAGNPNASSSAIMALNGPRMLQCGEGEERHRFDTAFIKQLSGSDALSGRHNHGEQMEFTPVAKLWLSANHLPDVPQQDEAMWRRIRVLPFDAKIESRDGAYENLLQAQAAGVLNWLIRGAKMYSEMGLGDCDVVSEASARARRSADSVAAWIKAHCEAVDGARLQSSNAFEDYRRFCRGQDLQALSVQRFKGAMAAKGHKSVETKRFNAYAGIQLAKL